MKIAVQNQNDYCPPMLSLAHEDAVKSKRMVRESLASYTHHFLPAVPPCSSALKYA